MQLPMGAQMHNSKEGALPKSRNIVLLLATLSLAFFSPNSIVYFSTFQLAVPTSIMKGSRQR
jgi:hypothetical protein